MKRLMIVDDNKADVLLAREALEAGGFTGEVVEKNSGEDALASLQLDRPLPDVILLDLNMTPMSGHQLLEKLKTNPMFRRIPVVILTTSNNDRDLERCYDLGCNGYIQKAADFDEFIDLLKVFREYWLERNLTSKNHQ